MKTEQNVVNQTGEVSVDSKRVNGSQKLRKMVISSMLGAITVVLGLTPLGLIPLGIINATTMHIPVIVGAILEGPVVGGAIGLIFGISSLVKAITMPNLLSFAIINPLVSIVPRVLIGVVSYYVYNFFANKKSQNVKYFSYAIYAFLICVLSNLAYKNINNGKMFSTAMSVVMIALVLVIAYFTYKKSFDNFAVVISAFVGSLTNTVLFLGMVYVLYGADYMQKLGKDPTDAGKVIVGIAMTSGIPEAVICVILVSIIVKTIKNIR